MGEEIDVQTSDGQTVKASLHGVLDTLAQHLIREGTNEVVLSTDGGARWIRISILNTAP